MISVRAKLTLLICAFASLGLAMWGAKQFMAGAFDPILKALGA